MGEGGKSEVKRSSYSDRVRLEIWTIRGKRQHSTEQDQNKLSLSVAWCGSKVGDRETMMMVVVVVVMVVVMVR